MALIEKYTAWAKYPEKYTAEQVLTEIVADLKWLEETNTSQLMPSEQSIRAESFNYSTMAQLNKGWYDGAMYIIKQSQPKKEGEKLFIKCEGCSCPFPDHCIYQKEKCEAPEGYGCSYIQSKEESDERIKHCPKCKKDTPQRIKAFDIDDDDKGCVWECTICNESIEFTDCT